MLISEAVRGEGAHLVNRNGDRFMQGLHPMAELAPRDVVSKSIVRHLAGSGESHVFLDCRCMQWILYWTSNEVFWSN